MRSSKFITLIVVIVVVVILAAWGGTGYNGMVKSDQQVQQAWAQVENQYQRRADLIPNLVSTVKGYATHESSTLESVTEARAGLSKAYDEAQAADASEAQSTQEGLEKYQQAQS